MNLTTTTAQKESPGVPPRRADFRHGRQAQDRVEHRSELIALALLLLGAGALYLIGLSVSGWGNIYYAAAAQAGAQSGHAMLYGASDVPASITVDKPPAAIWLMAASVRLFGLSPWSLLVPQALLGVTTVGLVYATVRRVGTARLALLAGVIVTTTPIAALVFRYNNPDALLTTLLAAAAYATARALENGRVRWVLVVGVLAGLAFLTKQLQAFLPVPGLVLAYLIAAPLPTRRRLRNVCIGGACTLVTAGWWVAAVQLTPAAERPYIGGSRTNSFIELTLGYNGLGRVFGGDGNGTESTGGLLRMFSGATGVGFSWLLPAALVLGIGALLVSRGRPRTDLRRGLLIASLGCLLASGAALSMMGGIYHSYYSVIMVPALAVTVAVGAGELWQRREFASARIILATAIGLTSIWSVIQLQQGPEGSSLVVPVVIVCGVIATLLLAVPRLGSRAPKTLAALAIVGALLGPAGVSVITATQPHHGAGPVAGYASELKNSPDPAVTCLLRQSTGHDWAAAVTGSVPAADYQLASGQSVMPIGGYTRTDPSPSLDQFRTWVAEGRIHWYIGTKGPVADWVDAHYSPLRVGGAIVYDLTAASPQPSTPASEQLLSTCTSGA